MNDTNLGLFGRFPKLWGTLLGGPYYKDYKILGSILGSPYFGKLPFGALRYKDIPTGFLFSGSGVELFAIPG